MKRVFWSALVLSPVFYFSCKGKQKNDFISVVGYLNSQVRHVDTSLYSIIRAEKSGTDSTWDTNYVKREEFRGLAKDFLNIPDLTDFSVGKKYKEERIYDDQLQRVFIVYTPVKDDQEILREEMVVGPGDTAFDKIRSVIIEKIKDYKDSSIHQRLLWQTNEKFQVVTIIEKNGEPISSKTLEVTWNPQTNFQEQLPTAPDTSHAALQSRHRKDSLMRKREEGNK